MTDSDETADEPQRLREALDRLYDAPLATFVALRKELANALKTEDAALAKRVASARRPDRAAWALNRVALRDRKALDVVFAAFDAAAAEQAGGDAHAWKRAVNAYREALGALAHVIRAQLASEGVAADTNLLRRITQAVAAASGDTSARTAMLAGRLATSADESDLLAGLGAPSAPLRDDDPAAIDAAPIVPAAPKSEARLTKKGSKEQAARRKAAEEAKRLERARIEKERAEAELAKKEAEATFARASKAAERAEADLARAKEQLERARDAVREAERTLTEARASLTQARAALEAQGAP